MLSTVSLALAGASLSACSAIAFVLLDLPIAATLVLVIAGLFASTAWVAWAAASDYEHVDTRE